MNTPETLPAPNAASNSADLWNIKPEDLWILEQTSAGNCAFIDPDKIRQLANIMLAQGYSKDKPLSAYVVTIENRDFVCVIDGAARLRAAWLAIQEGASIPTIPVLVFLAPANFVPTDRPQQPSIKALSSPHSAK